MSAVLPDGLTIARGAAARRSARRARAARGRRGRERLRIEALSRARRRRRRSARAASAACAQLRGCPAAARFAGIRGNVDTRLRKLDAGDFDALVLAAAGHAPPRLRGAHLRDASRSTRASRRRDRASSRSRSDRTTESARRALADARRSRDSGIADRRARAGRARSAAAASCRSARSRVHERDGRSACMGSSRLRTARAVIRRRCREPADDPAGLAHRLADALHARAHWTYLKPCGLACRPPLRSTEVVVTSEPRMKLPCVYIVGAGPGDPTLISVRGQRCLEAADVVVYDHRVHAAAAARSAARRRAHRRRRGRAQAARPGRDLLPARRKGARRQDRRPTEVGRPVRLRQRRQGSVVPARAGHPVRGGARDPGRDRRCRLCRHSGHVSGGRRRRSCSSAATRTKSDRACRWTGPGWRGLGGTLVCYAGAAADCRDARGAHRTRPRRRTRPPRSSTTRRCRRSARSTARSATIADAGGPTAGPALLVVGAVVGLRSHLRWFDDRPLSGRRIVVTRPREQAGELIDMLEERGAEAIGAPRSGSRRPRIAAALDAACASAATFDWIVFASANAVD